MLEQFNAVDIPLTNGGFATVDIADAPIALRHRWYRMRPPKSNVEYAMATSKASGELLLHRLLVAPDDGQHIDHKDGDGLNNRRSNIRVATRSQNHANRGVYENNKLGVKGVHRLKSGRYRAQIQVSGRFIHLGVFDTVEDASLAYQKAAREHFREFAYAI